MANYLYLDANGQKQGPVNAQQLKTLAAQGIITPETLLKADTGHQGKAGQIPGLFTAPPPTESNPSTATAAPSNNQTSPQNAAIPAVGEKRASQWYHHPVTVGIATVLFFPIGLVLLWTHPTWQRKTKIIVSGIVGFLFVIAAISNDPEETKQRHDKQRVAPAPRNERQAGETKPTSNSKRNKDAFDRIRMGMSYSEVVAIVGPPTETSVDSRVAGISTTIYTWHVRDSRGANFSVMIQKGKVINKAQAGLK